MKNLIFCMSLVTLIALPGMAQTKTYADAAGLHASQQCLLSLVRSHMGIKNPSPIAPHLKLESEIPLSEYQDAMESYWKFRPDVFGNVFDDEINTIFLTTNLAHYAPPRSAMDSLVHELSHFVQMRDQGGASGDSDILEAEAIKVQDWFRANGAKYIVNGKYTGPCSQ